MKEGRTTGAPVVRSPGNVEAVRVVRRLGTGNQQGRSSLAVEFLDFRLDEFFTVI